MVLRFTNTDVITNFDGVMDRVVGVLDGHSSKLTPTPNPFPHGGGESARSASRGWDVD